MIEQKQSFDQLAKEIKPAFQGLGVIKQLNGAGFKKKFGFTCAYLFRLEFVLLLHQKNWFRLLESDKSESLPEKDILYRSWRVFLAEILVITEPVTVERIEKLTYGTQDTVFIFDDSVFERNRSKKVEMQHSAACSDAACFRHPRNGVVCSPMKSPRKSERIS